MPVTMQQIADELGVSRLTISSVVNGVARERHISEATVTRVEAYLKQRGYVPARHARQMRGQVAATVGVLYWGYMYSHLHDAFNRLVQRLTVTDRELDILPVQRQNVVAGLRAMVSRRVRRLVWFHNANPDLELKDFALIRPLLAQFDQVIVYNFRFGETRAWEERLLANGVHLVGIDRRAGFASLAELLLKLGHRRVAVRQEEADEGSSYWQQGPVFREAGLQTFGFHEEHMPDHPTIEDGQRLASRIDALRRQQGVTAAAMINDEVSVQVMAALTDRGVCIPGDLTVTGFDGMPFCTACRVPLTTLAVPVCELVERVLVLLDSSPPAGIVRQAPVLQLAASHGSAPTRETC